MMHKAARLGARVRCRSISNVGLSAQWRSSSSSKIGRDADAAARNPATASKRSVALAFRVHDHWRRQFGVTPKQLRHQLTELGATPAAPSRCAQLGVGTHTREPRERLDKRLGMG